MRFFFPVLALILVAIWLFARIALAVTGFFLHLLWIAALIAFVIWLFSLRKT